MQSCSDILECAILTSSGDPIAVLTEGEVRKPKINYPGSPGGGATLTVEDSSCGTKNPFAFCLKCRHFSYIIDTAEAIFS